MVHKLPWLWHGWRRCVSTRYNCSFTSTSTDMQHGYDKLFTIRECPHPRLCKKQSIHCFCSDMALTHWKFIKGCSLINFQMCECRIWTKTIQIYQNPVADMLCQHDEVCTRVWLNSEKCECRHAEGLGEREQSCFGMVQSNSVKCECALS